LTTLSFIARRGLPSKELWKRYRAQEQSDQPLKWILAERKMKLREAAARRKEVNIGKKERLVNGATELGWSE